jgi:hypothetical protein
MNRPDDELAARIVQQLDHAAERLDPGTLGRLAAARRIALSHYRERPASVLALAWGTITGPGGQISLGARYALGVGALLAALIGFAYWQSAAPVNGNDLSDVDVKLLTDDLPINAYLDTGFDSWLKRAPR